VYFIGGLGVMVWVSGEDTMRNPIHWRRQQTAYGNSNTHTEPPRPGGFCISGTSAGQIVEIALPVPTVIATYCLPFTE